MPRNISASSSRRASSRFLRCLTTFYQILIALLREKREKAVRAVRENQPSPL